MPKSPPVKARHSAVVTQFHLKRRSAKRKRGSAQPQEMTAGDV